ncbi:MAG TPA: GAF domain-containing protein, partial [Chloroflexota bacterium]|nr:GAF domain-containing protein [Chloroflexota bacterium]
MTLMDYLILYLAVLIIGVEMALLAVVYLATPQRYINRVLALYLLALVVSAGGVVLLVTAPTFTAAAVGIWFHATAVFWAVWLLALVLLALFTPTFRYQRQFTWLVVVVGVAMTGLMVVDIFTPADLVYRFEAQDYVPGYLSLADYLVGRLGPLFYRLTVQSVHMLALPLLLVAVLVGAVPIKKYRSESPLLLMLAVLILANGVVLWLAPVLVGLVGSLSVAIVVAWGIMRYRVLSPRQIGERQALDTAVFGVLVFDVQGQLLEWNQTACRLLSLTGKESDYQLFTLLAQLAETAVNQDGIRAFIQGTSLPFTQNRRLGVIFADPSDDPSRATTTTWLVLQFSGFYADGQPAGILCTVEDQTAVHESQNELETAHQSLEQFAYRTALLNEITQTGASDLDLATMLQRFADRLGDLFLAHGCYITLWDDNQKMVQPGAAYGPMRQIYPAIPIMADNPTATETVLVSGHSLVVNDLANSPFSHFYQVPAFSGHSMLVAPLIAGGEKLGAVLIVFSQPNRVGPAEIDLGEQAASQIALAIAKMRLLQAEREQRELAETLHDIGTALTATLDYDILLDVTLTQIQRVVPYDTANITLLQRDEIHVARTAGYEAFTSAVPDKMVNEPFSLTSAATFRQVVETRQPLCLPDTRQFEGWVVTPATRHIRSWIGVPLLMSDEVIGFLCVDKTQPGFYDEGHKKRLAALANQVALALQHAQLFAESQRQAQRLSILNDLAAQMVGLVTVQELTDLVVERLYEDFDYDNVVIFMIDPQDPQWLFLQSVAGIYAFFANGRDHRQRVGEGIIGQTAVRGEYVLANDTAVHPDFMQPPEFDTCAELAVPIKIDRTILGVLNVDSHETYTFDQADVSLLTIVADQLATAIQKARLFELTRQRALELETLSIASAKLRAAHTVTDMLPIVLEHIVQAVNAAVGVVYLLDKSGEYVVSRAVYPEGSYLLGLKHRLGQGVTGHVAQTGKMYIAPDLKSEPRLYRQDGENEYLDKLHTSVALPLQTEDHIIGVVNIGLSSEHDFSEAELQLLTSLTDIAANALYRAQVMASLEERVEERTQALRQANIRLQELDRLKSKFISDVTHELRTPVANLNLYLDLLRVGHSEKKEHYLEVIEHQASRLTQLVQTTMQAPEVATMTPPEEFVDVVFEQVVRTAVSTYAHRAQNKGLTLTLEIAAELPPIRGDEAQLMQAVEAILTNAVNYTEAGTVAVTATWQAAAGMVCLQVADTGMGIDDEDMPYIFDRFYRGRKVGQLTIPGVGMGLFLVKEIVEWHNGR